MSLPVRLRQCFACATLFSIYGHFVVAAELPVRQVTLYKHGLGLFERDGIVPPGEDVRLDFQTGDMNDLLKSLTVSDAGGRVTAIRYDANETMEQRLNKFPFRLSSGESLSGFLDSLKGSRLEATVAGKAVKGSILGARQLPVSNATPAREQLTLLLENGELSNFDLGDLSSVRLLDVHQQEQLKAYLQTLADSNVRDKRSVYIQSDAKDSRRLRAMYIAPVPIWKSSYRLVMEDKGPLLEGWAIVDNTTGEDWDGIQLAVVSGRPISFISPLDTARYGQREIAELPEDRAAAPVVYGGSVDTSPAAGVGGVIGGNVGTGSGNGYGPLTRASKQFVANQLIAPAPAPPGNLAQTVEVTGSSVQGATGETIGELFAYDFAGPITIKKNESAMLPFLQSKIQARKLLIYTEQDSEHPVNAAELTNSTNKTLDGGPVTVYDGGAYAGEALFETLKAGDKRLIGYAVDYGTRVGTDFESGDERVREIHINDGTLTVRTAVRHTKTYSLRNVDAKGKTLIVQQIAGDERLLSPKPTERTKDAWRFEVNLAPNAAQTLKVESESLVSSESAISDATPDSILVYVENKDLPATSRQQLRAILDLKSQIVAADSLLADLKTQLTDVTADQSRLRSNIDSLNKVSGEASQVHQYSLQLAATESRIVKLRDQSREAQVHRQTLDSHLHAAIDKLAF